MCGIAGIIMRNGEAVDPAVLELLASALHHRGPDSCGLHVDQDVALVDTRLAIVDVAGGRQPLFGPQGAALVANGEIYNAPELRQSLGGAFATLSDCEPAVHLYEREGVDYAMRLRGMYAIAIHDRRADRVLLSRDPFGIKPLYYVETPALFAFASEPQALFAAGLARPVLREGATAELMQLKHVTGRATIFDGVERVEPGETLVLQGGRIVDRRRIPTVLPRTPTRRRLAAAVERFDAVMADSVAVHLRTDVPYGLFFSGGVDSTLLLHLMRRLSATPVRALTIGYEGRDPADESFGAMKAAGALGADCTRVEMGADDFWRLAPRVAAAVDDPTADPAVLPTYVLGRAARAAGLKVVLSGEGADELFGGYARYRRATLPIFGGRNSGKSGVFDGVAVLARAFGGWSGPFDAIARAAPGRSRLDRLQALDCEERLPNSLLVKLDRCLMAGSVEGRTPFLDREVAGFAATLPDRLRATPRHGKVLLRHWLAAHAPETR
ncbi:asparagine synthase (glutamine-hydrolyzing), partial [Caulobacter sp. S45]|uniref:asparagine synthase (glutamine-hydrolyzing) n=1 Tax=Caulobacter sp. S45 TaxID=1641861 RepID=UPI00157705B2